MDGTLSEAPLENAPFLQTLIENVAGDDPRLVTREALRAVTVTDMAYVDGLLLVAGSSNEEFSSMLRRITFPFNGEVQTNSIEISASPTASTRPRHRFGLSCRTTTTPACWQATSARP